MQTPDDMQTARLRVLHDGSTCAESVSNLLEQGRVNPAGQRRMQ